MDYRNPFGSQAVGQGQTQAAARDEGLRAYFLRIYNLMASALAVTGIVALLAANSPAFVGMLYTPTGISGIGWIVMLAPLGMVLWLSFGIHKMKTSTAQAVFWAYAVLMGLSLCSVFLVYTGASIARVFFVTAGTFGAMSLYGYTTKRDLTGMGSFLIMGLFGLIIASVVNMFMQSSGLHFALSVIGVLIFVGLTAYDTQKLKNMYYQLAGSGEMIAKMSIMGALNLYLDFINIFLYLLRFMGDRR